MLWKKLIHRCREVDFAAANQVRPDVALLDLDVVIGLLMPIEFERVVAAQNEIVAYHIRADFGGPEFR